MAAYNTEQKAGETLDQWYNRLAKVADQRLVRLEKLSQEEGFKGAENWAYASAMIDLEEWTPGNAKGKPRWNKSKPTTEAQIKMKIRDMRNFIESPTSTKQGIVSSYKKRADTFNAKYGTNFTWQTLATYYNRGMNEQMSKSIAGTDTALVIIGKIQKLAETAKKKNKKAGKSTNNKKILSDLRKAQETDQMASDSLTDELVAKILNDEGLAVSLLFSDNK